MSAPETVIVHTDGASRGNPGPASIGVVIAEPSGHVLREFGEALAPTTNNVAEYTAVIRALESALELGARRVQVQMDSQLVVRQLNGSFGIAEPRLPAGGEEPRQDDLRIGPVIAASNGFPEQLLDLLGQPWILGQL